jgi:RNA polymerase II subunit A small phosphatase-like protein
LVLDLDETLVHSTFQPVTNADLIVPVHLGEGIFQPIYVCKRPGVDEFLRQVSTIFEVVIFTASLSNVTLLSSRSFGAIPNALLMVVRRSGY